MPINSFYRVSSSEETNKVISHANSGDDLNARAVIPILLMSKVMWSSPDGMTIPDYDRQCLQAQQFVGDIGQCVIIHHPTGAIARIYAGQGDNTDSKRVVAILATQLPAGLCYELSPSQPINTLLAWALAQYRYETFKKNINNPRLLHVTAAEYRQILPLAEMVYRVRDLINAPTNVMGPQQLEDVARAMVAPFHAQMHVCVGDALLAENFPAIHAVGRASQSLPRLIAFTWGNPEHPRLSLVGKGVCFDSGGLDIKPSQAMRLMKKDMGGAAHALGLAYWIMQTQLPVYLEVLIPAVENAIGADAYRPGDVLTMRNGLTVEIDNTDAEGRLILADALVKACENQPDLLIDFSTLTGAARVAVGTEISALFTPQPQLSQLLQEAGTRMDDPIWPLPLHPGYASMIESNIADLSNSHPSSYAGAIIAGLFLQRFITDTVNWLHFDIMAWNVASKPGRPEGGEAMAVLALTDFLKNRYVTVEFS